LLRILKGADTVAVVFMANAFWVVFIIGKTALFEKLNSIEDSVILVYSILHHEFDYPGFNSLDFATAIFFTQ
jgi:hypothetical protein